jgi:hypothetical protein
MALDSIQERMHRLLSSSPVEFYGTPRERDVYERVLARNTPPEAMVKQYEVDAAYFRNDLMRSGRRSGFHSASMRKSFLFGSRYLCLYLSDERFVIAGHKYDAFCRASWGMFHSPVICLPKSKVRDQSRRFRSIVEHEIVHANQALLGRLPASAMERDDVWTALLTGRKASRADNATAAEAAVDVKAHTTAEFEAYFLQRGRWPDGWEDNGVRHITEFTLHKLCFAQGWTDALHRLLMGAYCGAHCVVAVLEELQRSMHSLLLALDALPEDADWFTADQRRLVASVARATEEANGPHEFREAALRWAAA